MVRTVQVTLTGSAQALNLGKTIAKWAIFQNNAAGAMRLGDSSVAAARGYALGAGATFSVPLANPTSQIDLAGWYVIGTATQVLDLIYEVGD